MKIGILTLPLHTNYGGILQAYALQTILESMGHDVIVFNVPERYSRPVYWKYPIRFIKRYILRKPVVVRYEDLYKKTFPKLARKIVDFRKRYVKEFVVEKLSDVERCKLDCIVVGSDQVWRPCYFKHMWKTSFDDAFLAFSKRWNIKRVSYAASFGVDFWELSKEETKRCKDAAQMFDAVSVREKSAIFLLRDYLKKNAELVLDPTLLMSKNEYEKLAKNAPQSKGDMFCYILDKTEDKKNLIDLVKREQGLVPFYVKNTIENTIADLKQDAFPSVESWIRGFIDSKFVVTDSFHACVFCIIFQKPFVAITNAERGITRLSSLLSLFHLEKNLITKSSAYDGKNNYYVPNGSLDILNFYKNLSLCYLKSIG